MRQGTSVVFVWDREVFFFLKPIRIPGKQTMDGIGRFKVKVE